MLKIFVILSPETRKKFKINNIVDLRKRVIPIVKETFGKKPTFTAIYGIETYGEAEVQVEIRYTVDDNETWWDPSSKLRKKRKEMTDKIREEFNSFRHFSKLDDYRVSIQCRPCPGSSYELCKMD